MWNKIRRMLPHLVILISNMYLVFFAIDRVNTAMKFIDNGLTKGLLLVLCLAALVNAWGLVHPSADADRQSARRNGGRGRSSYGTSRSGDARGTSSRGTSSRGPSPRGTSAYGATSRSARRDGAAAYRDGTRRQGSARAASPRRWDDDLSSARFGQEVGLKRTRR